MNQRNITIRFWFWGIILLRVFKCWRVIFVVFIQIIVIIKKFGLGLGQFSRARSGPAGWRVLLLPEPGEKKWWTLSWLTPTPGSVVRHPGERAATERWWPDPPPKTDDEHGSITECSVQECLKRWVTLLQSVLQYDQISSKNWLCSRSPEIKRKLCIQVDKSLCWSRS